MQINGARRLDARGHDLDQGGVSPALAILHNELMERLRS
jgi:hypothetical protein